jgi:polyhydroxybutyrate depolymerase
MLEVSWKMGRCRATLASLVVAACNMSGPPLPGQGGGVSLSPAGGSGGSGVVVGGSSSGSIGGAAGNAGVGGDAPAANGSDAVRPNGLDAGAAPGAGSAPVFINGPSPGCQEGAPRATSGPGTLSTSSGERAYSLHVPTLGAEPRPLVLAMHGYTLNAAEQERVTRLSEVADREGFVVVYPDGLGSPTSWNAGPCCSYDDKARDDIGFLTQLIDDLGERLCLDQGRVYATGFSNGGMMAYRMACDRSDRIAAIASVAGSMVLPEADCHPVRPVPVMHTHGSADPIVPFAGGAGPAWLTPAGETPAVFPSVAAEIALFAEINGCSSDTETVFDELDTRCVRQSSCTNDASVMSCTVTGGGHAWPGGADIGLLASLIMGSQSATLPTSQVMWDFLKAHRLP